MPAPYVREKEYAYQAVVRAAAISRQVQTDMPRLSAATKVDRSPVTLADYAVQAVICQGLAAAFPDDPVVAEEKAADLRRPDQAAMLAQVTGYVQQLLPGASPSDVCAWIDRGSARPGPRFWTLDPIDGTKGFLRGEQYAIALALIEAGQVQVGALACPNLPVHNGEALGGPAQPVRAHGVVFLAVRGGGAEMLPLSESSFAATDNLAQRIAVAGVTNPQAARFVESVESAHSDQAAHAWLARRLGITQPPVRLDSQAKYGLVARGEATLYLRLPSPRQPDYRENIWDHAAGALIVEEAGGRVTDALGAALDFGQGRQLARNQGVIVSNGYLHPAVLEALQGWPTD